MKCNFDLKLLENIGFVESDTCYKFFIDEYSYYGGIYVDKEDKTISIFGDISCDIGNKIVEKLFDVFSLNREMDTKVDIEREPALEVFNKLKQYGLMEKCFDNAVSVIAHIGGCDCCGCKYDKTDLCETCGREDGIKKFIIEKTKNGEKL